MRLLWDSLNFLKYYIAFGKSDFPMISTSRQLGWSLNCDKTEVLWSATSRRQHQRPCSALSVDGTLVKPVKSARDIGIYIVADLQLLLNFQSSATEARFLGDS